METQQLSRLKLAVILFSVFIASFGVLAFEISLTRIFSVMLDYHYTFLVVSLALFGLGLGGVGAHYLSGKTLKENFSRLAILSIASSLLMAFLTLATISAPGLDVSIQIFVMFIPFLVAGTVLAMAYKLFVSQSNLLHFVDLAGAALGSLAIVFLINWAGAPSTVMFISAITMVSGTLFSVISKRKTLLVVSLLAIIGLSVLAQFGGNIIVQPGANPAKEISSFLLDPSSGAKIEQSKWTSFGQVDLLSLSNAPHQKVIFVDGGAGTSLYHFNGNFSDSSNSLVPMLQNTTRYFPYNIANKCNSLVIGPGGGVDVLTALTASMKNIDAVDVNPGVVDIVKEQWAYDGGIYTNYGNVHVTVDDGRSFVKRSNTQYDVIMLDIPLTKTAQGSLGYSLAENYLFTTDSFNDYLNHLTDDGMLTIVAHNQEEIYKLTTLAYSVLSDQGMGSREIFSRIAIVGSSDHMDHNALPVFMLKKTAITQDQAQIIDTKAKEIGLQTLYSPLKTSTLLPNAGPSTDPYLRDISMGRLSIDALANVVSPYNLTPPTDDTPFFYNFNSGPPETLVLLLAGAVMLCIIVSAFYIAVRRRNKMTDDNGRRVLYEAKFSGFKWYIFASLGFGFMLIEVALIQKFILFLGEPTSAIAMSLFSLLLAGGIGSLFSKKWLSNKQINAFRIALAIGILTVSYIFLMPLIFNAALSYSTLLRFVISFALISPLGFLMGIPFPTALGYIKHEYENDAVWLWCINGAFSVLAGVIALIVAMSYGFNAVLIVGAATYIALFVVGQRHELKLLTAIKRKLAEPPRTPKVKRTWHNGKPIDRPQL